jgi:hypothetical protein
VETTGASSKTNSLLLFEENPETAMAETIRSYGAIWKSTGKKTLMASIAQTGSKFRVYEGGVSIYETEDVAIANEVYMALRDRLMAARREAQVAE